VKYLATGCVLDGVGHLGTKRAWGMAEWVKFPVSRYYYVHRLVCQIHQNMERLPDGMHVSHLCHYSLCCNFSHLTWEPQVVNNQKQTCRD